MKKLSNKKLMLELINIEIKEIEKMKQSLLILQWTIKNRLKDK